MDNKCRFKANLIVRGSGTKIHCFQVENFAQSVQICAKVLEVDEYSMLHFPINDKCNLVNFPSRQILSLEHHRYCLHTCAPQHNAGFLGALYIWSVQTFK